MSIPRATCERLRTLHRAPEGTGKEDVESNVGFERPTWSQETLETVTEKTTKAPAENGTIQVAENPELVTAIDSEQEPTLSQEFEPVAEDDGFFPLPNSFLRTPLPESTPVGLPPVSPSGQLPQRKRTRTTSEAGASLVEDATPVYDRLGCELQLVSHTLDIIDGLLPLDVQWYKRRASRRHFPIDLC